VSDPADDLGIPVVDLPPSARASPEAAVHFLVRWLVRSGRLQPGQADRVTCQVLHRESLGSTGIGRGIAVPHALSDAVGQVLGVAGRAAEPLAWPGASDSVPVRVVCLLVMPVSAPGASLRALEAAVRLLRRGSRDT
jgi:PTS system nitrogen regulatory IIA component